MNSTGTNSSAEPGGGFNLRVTVLSETADLSGMDGGLPRTGTRRLMAGSFAAILAAELAASGEAMPLEFSLTAVDAPIFIASYATATPEWIEANWSSCDWSCHRQRWVTCSVFGGAASCASAVRPPDQSACPDGMCAMGAGAGPVMAIVTGIGGGCCLICFMAVFWKKCCTLKKTGSAQLNDKGSRASYRIDVGQSSATLWSRTLSRMTTAKTPTAAEATNGNLEEASKTTIVWDVKPDHLQRYFPEEGIVLSEQNGDGMGDTSSDVMAKASSKARWIGGLKNAFSARPIKFDKGTPEEIPVNFLNVDPLDVQEPAGTPETQLSVPVHRPRFAYMDYEVVEYFSSTLGIWVLGHVQVSHKFKNQGRSALGRSNSFCSTASGGATPSREPARYDVKLLKGGQVRVGVTLDLIRRTLADGEPVEVLLQDGWHTGRITGEPCSSATTLGYSVELSRSGNTLHRVRPERLRRFFPEGSAVEAYYGVDGGWVSTTVCAHDAGPQDPSCYTLLKAGPSCGGASPGKSGVPPAEGLGAASPGPQSLFDVAVVLPPDLQPSKTSKRPGAPKAVAAAIAPASAGPSGGPEQFWKLAVIENGLEREWYPSYLLRHDKAASAILTL